MAISQLSLFVENKPGALLGITRILADQHVNIRALSLADASEYGVLRLIVDQPERAKTALEDAGHVLRVSEVIGVAMSDTPGALAGVMTTLGAHGVNIEYMYAFLSRATQDAYVILRTDDCAKAEETLLSNGAKLLVPTDID